MKKFIFILSALLFTSCIQLNIASSVINAPPVIKTQYNSKDAKMYGSDLKDVSPEQKAGDVTVPVKP